jgi:hypothetical protein
MSYRLDPHEFRAWLDALHPLPLTPALALRILDKIAADG